MVMNGFWPSPRAGPVNSASRLHGFAYKVVAKSSRDKHAGSVILDGAEGSFVLNMKHVENRFTQVCGCRCGLIKRPGIKETPGFTLIELLVVIAIIAILA